MGKNTFNLLVMNTIRNVPDVFLQGKNTAGRGTYFGRGKNFFFAHVEPPARQGQKKDILPRPKYGPRPAVF